MSKLYQQIKRDTEQARREIIKKHFTVLQDIIIKENTFNPDLRVEEKVKQ